MARTLRLPGSTGAGAGTGTSSGDTGRSERPTARVGRAPMGAIRERSAPPTRTAETPKSPVLTVITRAVMAAAKNLRRDFGEVENLQFSRKGPGDFVSQADIYAEKVLREHLLKGRPSYGFLGEETEARGGDGRHRWIVDPLDGTTNFMHGIPHFAISVALETDGDIVAGVVYNPVTDEMFYAEKGRGAWVEAPSQRSRRLRVSGRTQLDTTVIATGMPHAGKGRHDRFAATLQPVMAKTAGVRRYGAAALDLAWVAAARFDGFWEFDLSPWDVAAGILLVTEAGGTISDIAGEPYALGGPSILACNGVLKATLAETLAGG